MHSWLFMVGGETEMKCLHFRNTGKAFRTDPVLRRDQNILFHLLNARLN